MSPHFEKKEKN